MKQYEINVKMERFQNEFHRVRIWDFSEELTLNLPLKNFT